MCLVGLEIAESATSCLLPNGRKALERAGMTEPPRLPDAEMGPRDGCGTRARKSAWTTRLMISPQRRLAQISVVLVMSSAGEHHGTEAERETPD